ncbi:MAG TPA: hypothetical protein VGO93_30240, partial [Candidatus Xenobia bacterium]
ARLASNADAHLPASLAAADRQQLAARLKSIDDVRPLAAVVTYLFSQFRDHRAIQQAILEVLRGLSQVPLVQARLLQAPHWGNPPWILRILPDLARVVGIQLMLRVGGWFDRLSPGDNLASCAAQELKRERDPEPLYVLFGHTHEADQVPLSLSADRHPQAYLNTGTWRPVHRQTLDRHGFISTKGLSYSVVYHPRHDPGSQAGKNPHGYPTIETWTGALLDPPATPDELAFSSPRTP